MDLASVPTLVESPFVILKIGEYTFGSYQECTFYKNIKKVTFPSMMTGVTINKVNGEVNTYTISLVYALSENDDPNLIEKILSTVSDSRKIYLSYGDWCQPTQIYREEECIITNVTSSLNWTGNTITYQITAISNTVVLSAARYSFNAITAKPSDIIKGLFAQPQYGLVDVFKGMSSTFIIDYLIVSNDKEVTIEAKNNVSVLDYINYLVSCMINVNTPDASVTSDSVYHLVYYDDINNEYGGPYLKITEISKTVSVSTQSDVYEVDIGYPGANLVTGFNVNNNQQWGIVYNYKGMINRTDAVYRLNDNGQIVSQVSPTVTRNEFLRKTTAQDKTWWTNMTEFPISATLDIKGLIRPAVLMNYVKINVYFFGNKSVYSGLYVITAQQDTIDRNGYRTQLSLQRIAGDDSYGIVKLDGLYGEG